jgi:hypothetical protein
MCSAPSVRAAGGRGRGRGLSRQACRFEGFRRLNAIKGHSEKSCQNRLLIANSFFVPSERAQLTMQAVRIRSSASPRSPLVSRRAFQRQRLPFLARMIPTHRMTLDDQDDHPHCSPLWRPQPRRSRASATTAPESASAGRRPTAPGRSRTTIAAVGLSAESRPEAVRRPSTMPAAATSDGSQRTAKAYAPRKSIDVCCPEGRRRPRLRGQTPRVRRSQRQRQRHHERRFQTYCTIKPSDDTSALSLLLGVTNGL